MRNNLALPKHDMNTLQKALLVSKLQLGAKSSG